MSNTDHDQVSPRLKDVSPLRRRLNYFLMPVMFVLIAWWIIEVYLSF